jgi:1-deoxy-D-xylulose-5-phosphate reductoisomerase
MPKRIALLGSTGSIGTQALEVLSELNDQGGNFEVVALAAGRNVARLVEQIGRFRPRLVSLERADDLQEARRLLGNAARQIEWVVGTDGLQTAAAKSDADLVINGLVGAIGLQPTLTALEAGIDLALANKESLAVGGHLVRSALKRGGARLLPIDSEHSALFQLLAKQSPHEISRLVLTASGGALRDWPLDQLHTAKPTDVLRHPNWTMGQRITVDSATLVNKGLEAIEAHWLFSLPYERISAVIHPQSIVHGLIELCDGAFLAHLGAPDMKMPLLYALTYPQRHDKVWSKLELTEISLGFAALDAQRYPAFFTVTEAGRLGGSYPAAINAADEVLVTRFLRGEIAFTDISAGLAQVLQSHQSASAEPELTELLAADAWARECAAGL